MHMRIQREVRNIEWAEIEGENVTFFLSFHLFLHLFVQMSDRGNAHIVEDPRYKKMKIICILEGAFLETVKTKKVGNSRLLYNI